MFEPMVFMLSVVPVFIPNSEIRNTIDYHGAALCFLLF
jgi:hypothetical protein